MEQRQHCFAKFTFPRSIISAFICTGWVAFPISAMAFCSFNIWRICLFRHISFNTISAVFLFPAADDFALRVLPHDSSIRRSLLAALDMCEYQDFFRYIIPFLVLSLLVYCITGYLSKYQQHGLKVLWCLTPWSHSTRFFSRLCRRNVTLTARPMAPSVFFFW